MAYTCPLCKQTGSLEVSHSIALPPDDRCDDISLQTVACAACGFRGAAIYEESRRGGGDSWHHYCFAAPPAELDALMALIDTCPDSGDTRCRCAAHRRIGRYPGHRWAPPVREPTNPHETYAMRWSEPAGGRERPSTIATSSARKRPRRRRPLVAFAGVIHWLTEQFLGEVRENPKMFAAAFFFLIGFFIWIIYVDFSTRVDETRTAARLRTVAAVLEAYHRDHSEYPKTDSAEGLVRALSPAYATEAFMQKHGSASRSSGNQVFVDEWLRPLAYQCWSERPESRGCDSYALASAGKFGTFERTDFRRYSSGALRGKDDDIVIRNGEFVRYPPGLSPR